MVRDHVSAHFGNALDEGGGCWCGSLFVAGVGCDQAVAHEFVSLGLKESKQLSRAKRFEWATRITQDTRIASVVVAKSALEIDNKGLSVCMQEAITQIILGLSTIKHVRLDGNTLFKLEFLHLESFEAIIKGDDKIPQIGMASILAKAHKDQEMLALDELYPEYGFAKHCGYGTRTHALAITQHGLIKEHRKSFKFGC
ncbi:ribonuclease HII [Helicobacter bizzozeronii]|uniref:ribonuclease HII n=2 Tax=Helicobacter bizzozeronii TaxID=56877 RepID=UPI001FF845E9|nr:ribonuclease HII [Helicobacter bizzozeronii]